MNASSGSRARLKSSAAIAGSLFLLALGSACSKADQRPKTLLAVFAHPDDEAFVGPLLSHYARRGVRVQLAIVTDGGKGGRAPDGAPAGRDIASIRADEARCSCHELGIEPPILLGFRDDELGRPNDPPAGYLAEVVQAVRGVLARSSPDAVVTWGPEGGYGHPDHRLVGDVVTELVQAGLKGVPSRLFYPGLPEDRVRRRPGDPRWAVTDARFLTVRVPYDEKDLAATRKAFACHESQYPADRREALVSWLHETLGGRLCLRPWFGGGTADDVFALPAP
ncbi:MAG TPA: PIG-L deacetylase family protein [Vicinamibacteria bacterium]|nr:PIG-L deacetylase family protein [Vicinamibacteria bacterium]